ncbi:MAG: tetratricopeptide repeat protein [Anaerolineae bacterium]
MAKNQEYAEQLGRAWALHRQGQNDAAIHEFSSLLQTSANNVDALYGLALAQRSGGQIEAAQVTFERCLTQIGEAIQSHPREDRYQMLQKMTRQRIDELKDGKS